MGEGRGVRDTAASGSGVKWRRAGRATVGAGAVLLPCASGSSNAVAPTGGAMVTVATADSAPGSNDVGGTRPVAAKGSALAAVCRGAGPSMDGARWTRLPASSAP
jgi:hypothetical protein